MSQIDDIPDDEEALWKLISDYRLLEESTDPDDVTRRHEIAKLMKHYIEEDAPVTARDMNQYNLIQTAAMIAADLEHA